MILRYGVEILLYSEMPVVHNDYMRGIPPPRLHVTHGVMPSPEYVPPSRCYLLIEAAACPSARVSTLMISCGLFVG